MDHHALGDAAERQADLKPILGHRQVPELVLKDDRHSSPDTGANSRGDSFTPSACGQKGDEEMMVSGQAVLGGVGQNAAQYTAAARRAPGRRIGYDRWPLSVLSRFGCWPADRQPELAHWSMLLRRRPEVSRCCRRWQGNRVKRFVTKG